MIRAAFFACICLMIVTVACAAGVLSQWDTVWWLLILPASGLLAWAAAEASVERYHWWALARAERRARDYARAPIWHPQVQRTLNIRVDRLAARVR